jgi:AcrR family transcriptional regulator
MAKELKENADLKRYIALFAFNEFKRKGVKSVKMDDLASGLGISKRTIYELFEDKEELLVEGLKYDAENTRKALSDILNEGNSFFDSFMKWLSVSISQIRGINCNFLLDLAHYQKVQEYFNQQKNERHENAKYFMERGVAEGVFRDDIDYDLLITTHDMLKEALVNSNVFNEINYNVFFKSVQLVTLRGICTEKGLQILNRYEF